MKKFRLIFTAAAVFAVVGSAFALTTRTVPNIRFCSAANICIAQNTYSTVAGTPTVPPVPVYTGTVGALCNSIACPRFNGQAFINP